MKTKTVVSKTKAPASKISAAERARCIARAHARDKGVLHGAMLGIFVGERANDVIDLTGNATSYTGGFFTGVRAGWKSTAR